MAGAYDVLVVGAGAAGGLAAQLLTEAGLRVLVLDAGAPKSQRGFFSRRLIRSAILRLRGPAGVDAFDRKRQPVQSRCYVWSLAPGAFVDDFDCPYVTPADRPFIWVRCRQLGGRMMIPGHGQQYYRLGSSDFAPADGLSPAWPLRPGELDPWYSLVERRLELFGTRDGLPWLPDSEIAHVLERSPAEAELQCAISTRWPGYRSVLARFGDPFNALDAAARTGRLLVYQGAIVREVVVDRSGRVRGVVWLDQRTRSVERASAPLVFLCASTLESTRVLLLSRSSQGTGGLGASSGVLGRHLMDHVMVRGGGQGPPVLPGAAHKKGRCLYLPRFDARELGPPRAGRGFGVQLYQGPAGTDSYLAAASFAEMLPRPENRVTLDPERRDAWGIPVLRIECAFSEAELARAHEQAIALRALAEVVGVTITWIEEPPLPPGSAMHECGTARMGSDPATSVLDSYNQCWEAQGLYVTDGACFPSQGSQNPTLTILALTARACDHAQRTARSH
jgi:choline dehydrogenase-like flavoprotein